jgi:hypothetical protein
METKTSSCTLFSIDAWRDESRKDDDMARIRRGSFKTFLKTNKKILYSYIGEAFE